MNIREYIESGILEAYVLGALSSNEREQVQAEVAAHSQLADEVNAIENTMFQYVQTFAIDPPAALQEKFWNLIGIPHANAANSSSQAKSITIPLNSEYRKPAMEWKYAATLIILVGSLVLNFVFWNQAKQVRDEKNALSYRVDKLQSEQKQLAANLESYKKAKNMMADTAMQTIVMHTVVKGHPMAATVFWSKDKGDTYVAMDGLPEAPNGMQYQLWVIQNGKPVSMGTLPNGMANTPAMQKVPMQVTSGEAFAISLEKEGGSPAPTTVYVLGKA